MRDLSSPGQDVAFEDAEIYASSSMAVLLNNMVRPRLERMRVLPRPGTDRLISSNADGLNLSMVAEGGVIRDSEVRRTLDDGLAVNSVFLAGVLEAPSPSRLAVKRYVTRNFENGLLVNFIDTSTAEELTGGRIVSQTPAFGAPIVSAGTVQVEFDRGLPPVRVDFGMVYADATRRGVGTVVENNLVEDVLFARGIYLAGVAGVTVRNNIVRRTASGGIVAYQAMQIGAFAAPPVRDIQILGNTVEDPIAFGTIAGGSYAALGGITVMSASSNAGGTTRPVTTRANRRVTIAGNSVTGSGRSGIWVSNVAEGSVTDNVVVNHNRRPALTLVGVPVADRADMSRDFVKAVAVRFSDAVQESGNTP